MSDDGYRAPAELMRRYGLAAKKSWGQCFLHEPSIARRIVTAIGASEDETVVEIGAGLGALTGLLARRHRRVVAIERDRDLVAVLREALADEPNIELHEANALTFDFGSVGEALHVVGNLPYNISSPLLFHLLAHRPVVRSATVMLQRELAQRLTARPGSRLYGAPTITLGLRARIATVLQVRRGAFLPPPNVDSTVIHLDFSVATTLTPAADALLERVVRGAFSARRKKLRKALSAHFAMDVLDAAFAAAEIDSGLRAEMLSLGDFARLTEAIAMEAKDVGLEAKGG
ncbi:MAG: ribosomal RNA small subunit methyltransferase A [Proteobacteria bacterium]|nr:MAG: ribosomal RNA small subunit methyltransferase A [Pseudomonadota bacterium]